MALSIVASATGTFTGVEDFVDVVWPAIVGSFLVAIGVVTTDGSVIACEFAGAPTATGGRLQPTARFHGTVNVLCFQ